MSDSFRIKVIASRWRSLGSLRIHLVIKTKYTTSYLTIVLLPYPGSYRWENIDLLKGKDLLNCSENLHPEHDGS